MVKNEVRNTITLPNMKIMGKACFALLLAAISRCIGAIELDVTNTGVISTASKLPGPADNLFSFYTKCDKYRGLWLDEILYRKYHQHTVNHCCPSRTILLVGSRSYVGSHAGLLPLHE